MQAEWDEAKSERCLRERGFSFADVLPAFTDPDRLIYGRVAERWFVIVYTMRSGNVRIISARRANARERRRFG